MILAAAKRFALAALLGIGVPIVAAALRPPRAAAESATVSANWSGYAVTGASRPARFHRVAGTWVQPSGRCVAGQETYAVTWVGLGGFNRGSRALEQAGTAVDCTPGGRAAYSAWYELVPAAPVTLRLHISPGETIGASVAQKRGKTIMQVRDLTSGATRTVVRTTPAPDLSSAEWIVEAPSICLTARRCTPLPLTDFGTVQFSNASLTTAKSRRDAIDTASLKVTKLELRDYSKGVPGPRVSTAVTQATGIPSELSTAGNAFTVTWQALDWHGPGPPDQPEQKLTSATASIRR